MDIVKRDRRALKMDLTRIEQTVATFDVATPTALHIITVSEGKISQVSKTCTKLVEKCSAVAANDAEFDAETAEFTAISDRIEKVEIKLTGLKSLLPPTTAATGGADIKLPKIEIPPFKGDTQEWLSFQDLFTSSIHSNVKLSGSQKLQYLKGLLQDKPASLIKDVPVTDGNYKQAWDILKSRYEIKRDIIRSHFDKLLTLQNLQQVNPVMLRKIGDAINECNRALDILKITPEQKWNCIVIHAMARKLDPEARVEWEKKLASDEIPTIEKFTEFILAQARATAAGGIKGKPSTIKNNENSYKKATSVHFSSKESNELPPCPTCKENHPIFKCSKFREESIDSRIKLVKQLRLCFICLKSHNAQDCPKKWTCRKCHQKHNELLHREEQTTFGSQKKESSDNSEKTEQEPSKLNSCFSYAKGNVSQVLLSTALILVKDSKNQDQLCRALLDDGSQGSFITSNCATKLGLKRKNVTTTIIGVGEIDVGKSTQSMEIQFSSHHNKTKTFSVQTHIKDTVTGNLPSLPVSQKSWPHIENLKLADPKFYDPRRIDILLGCDVYEELVLSKKLTGPKGTSCARNSVLGWILRGPIEAEVKNNQLLSNHVYCDLESTLQRFWELEDVSTERQLTKEELQCEQHFEQFHERDATGRIVVRLPFKSDKKILGESRDQAVRRFKQVERRYSNQPENMKAYNDVLEDYLNLNHMEKVPISELKMQKEIYYIPHLILIRFRTFIIALCADIVKMYRQVRVHRDDCDYQRLVWRRSQDDPIEDYRLLTVTFGVASAPYLAIKSVQKLALNEKENFPNSHEVVTRDFYVDDFISGANSEEEAKLIQKELIKLLQLGGFELRKWSSNSPAVLESVPEDYRETNLPLDFDMKSGIKTLGYKWNPANDVFLISVVMPPKREKITKRSLLSDLAKTFDPIGFLSPATIKAKLIFQSLWKIKLDWDGELPQELTETWSKYIEEFSTFEDIQIPRCIIVPQSVEYQIHGFCDASDVTYAACVYLVSRNEKGDSKAHLVAAKTRVAPVKYMTTARGELCAAVLLVSLVSSNLKSFNHIPDIKSKKRFSGRTQL